MNPGPNMVALLLSQILDEPYPRVSRKRSAATADLDENTVETDYASTNRTANDPLNYKRIAYSPAFATDKFRYDVLASKFPRIPAILIHQSLAAHNQLYAPTYIYLHNLLPENYSPLKAARGTKATVARELGTPAGREVSVEMEFIEIWLEGVALKEEVKRKKQQEEEDAEAARLLNFREHEVNGGLLEWYFLVWIVLTGSGCCFDECPLNCMTACGEGHLFCLDCARRSAETTVGNGGHVFKCMDLSGCKAEFPGTEIARFVDAKTIALRDKLASGDAIREVWCLRFCLDIRRRSRAS